MGAARHGIVSDSVSQIGFGVGAIFFGAWTDEDTPGTLLGAVAGGTTFTLTRGIWTANIAGQPGKLQGADRIIEVGAMLEAALQAISGTSLEAAIANCTLTAATPAGYDTIEGSGAGTVGSAELHDNVTVVTDMLGLTNGFILQLDDALPISELSIALADKDQFDAAGLKWEARFDPAALTTEPWRIFIPTT
ncbi:MAG: hypothetical protein KAY24_18285 [Candidatus Eisenbacteria sp.]|nr:hypothetical protein [Candidatus Eisenbacteria bacterium]